MNRLCIVGLSAAAVVAASLGSSGAASVAEAVPPSDAIPAASRAGTTPDPAFAPPLRAAELRRARVRAPQVAEQLGLSSQQRLHVTDVERDADGTLHVRYSRTLGGLRVMGGDLVVHQGPGGAVDSAEFATRQPLTVATDVDTRIGSARASVVARQGTARSTATSAAKVVWAVDGIPRLAWLVEVTPSRHGISPRAVVVDASTGRRIQSWDLHQEAEGRGRSLYSGRVRLQTVERDDVFRLKDATRGGSVTVDLLNRWNARSSGEPGRIFTDADNIWGNGKRDNRQTAGVDAAYGAAQTWDYYLDTFGRTGIANDGEPTTTRVHYGKRFDNAFWDDGCFCMTYGDGGRLFKPLVSVDVAGHEMTHGVTSATAGLNYFGDAGGLNESTSDIFGTLVELTAHTAQNPGNYRLGELVTKPSVGNFLRRMDKPSADGLSYDCWSRSMGEADPHFSSGPGNHFFYLLAEGSGRKRIGGYPHNSPVCGSAAAVRGIGHEKAAEIWYRALTRYFLSTSSYIDARDATIRSAVDLYGKDSPECRQVVRSWNAVAVPPRYWSCAGGVDAGRNVFGANPGFEKGDRNWKLRGEAAISRDRGSGLCMPRRGHWCGILNGAGRESTGKLTHSLRVPDTATATLRFSMLLSARSPNPRHGTLDITINGQAIPHGAGHFDSSSTSSNYYRWDIPVDKWRGQRVRMAVVGHERSGFYAFLDDFALTPR